MLWYLFDYKYANGIISFGNLSYDKVIDKCIQSEIGILIASREKEEFSFVGDIEVYSSYCLLANKAFDKQERKKKTILLLEKILDKYPQYNEEIEKFLTDLVEEITEKSME